MFSILFLMILLASTRAKLNNEKEKQLFIKSLPPSLSWETQSLFKPNHTVVVNQYSVPQINYIWVNSTMEEINEVGLEIKLYGILYPDYPRYELNLTTIEFVKCLTGSTRFCVKLPCEIRRQFWNTILDLPPYKDDNFMEIMVSSWNDELGFHLLAKYERRVLECVDVESPFTINNIIISELMSNKQFQLYYETIDFNLYEYYNGGIIDKEIHMNKKEDLLIHIFQSFNAFTQIIIKCMENTTAYGYQYRWDFVRDLSGWYILIPDIPITMDQCYMSVIFERVNQQFKFEAYWFFMQQFIPKVTRPNPAKLELTTSRPETTPTETTPTETTPTQTTPTRPEIENLEVIPELFTTIIQRSEFFSSTKLHKQHVSVDIFKITAIILTITMLVIISAVLYVFFMRKRKRFIMLSQKEIL
jgi:hypothetical protein